MSPSFSARAVANRAHFETLEPRRMFSVTPSVVEVPISAAAIAADPALANYRSFDLRLTITSGDKWAGCDMRANLTSGDFYNVPYPVNTPIPQIWPTYPHFEFDTFVSDYNFASPMVVNRGIPNSSGPSNFWPTAVNASWLSSPTISVSSQTQVITAARLTVRQGATGSIIGRLGQISTINTLMYFSFSITANGIVPSSGSLITGMVTGYDMGQTTPAAGRTVYIDYNNNGVLDPTEQRTTTDSTGAYFLDVSAGTYVIRQVLPYGWRNSGYNFWSVSIGAGRFDSSSYFGSARLVAPIGVVPASITISDDLAYRPAELLDA